MNARSTRRRDDEENVAAIARLFAAVDAIDADVSANQKPYPNRGTVPCPTCGGTIAYVNLTEFKGAGRCSTPDCVDFAPLARV